MKVTFHKRAFEEYQALAVEDRKAFLKLNKLIEEISRTPFTGTGQPEQLKYELSGFWSRRINGEDRVVYMVTDDTIIIASCQFHY